MMQPVIRRSRVCSRFSKKSSAASGSASRTAWRCTARPIILALGYMANMVRERLHGNVTYFNVNRHINPTDVCVASCRLCAFGKTRAGPEGLHDVARSGVGTARARASREAVTEFHIVGGLHPELTLDWYCEMLRGLKQRFPQVHLKAFTMVEIAYLAQRHEDLRFARRWSA